MPPFEPNKTRSFCGLCSIVRWPNSTVRWTVPGRTTCRWSGERWRGDRIEGRSRPGFPNWCGGLGAPWDGGSGCGGGHESIGGAESPPPDGVARAPVDRGARPRYWSFQDINLLKLLYAPGGNERPARPDVSCVKVLFPMKSTSLPRMAPFMGMAALFSEASSTITVPFGTMMVALPVSWESHAAQFAGKVVLLL